MYYVEICELSILWIFYTQSCRASLVPLNISSNEEYMLNICRIGIYCYNKNQEYESIKNSLQGKTNMSYGEGDRSKPFPYQAFMYNS